jgi:hypothetical protein
LHTTFRGRQRALVTALAVLALSAATVLTSSGAQARPLRFADPVHDVRAIDFADPTLTGVADPTTTNADIDSAFLHYRTGRLVVRLNFVDLRPAANTLLDFTGEVRTNEHRRYAFDVQTTPGHSLGHDQFLSKSGRSRCEIGHFYDYAHDFARVSIPLSCLSRPRWVQVRMGAATLTFDPSAFETRDLRPGDLVMRLDLAQRDTKDATGWTPRVHR